MCRYDEGLCRSMSMSVQRRSEVQRCEGLSVDAMRVYVVAVRVCANTERVYVGTAIRVCVNTGRVYVGAAVRVCVNTERV